jgi:transcriptional regulator with XRE-family HTH domain
MTTQLLDETLQMARESALSVPQLAAAAGVESRWLYMLLSGKIKDPGVRRLARLHDYLSFSGGQSLPEDHVA